MSEMSLKSDHGDGLDYEHISMVPGYFFCFCHQEHLGLPVLKTDVDGKEFCPGVSIYCPTVGWGYWFPATAYIFWRPVKNSTFRT